MDYGKLIQGSIDFIEERLTDRLNVDTAARETHFSRFHYQRIFVSVVGEPIMEYAKKRRLTLAAQELVETSVSITDIALKYGYESLEGFSRAFKAYHGVTPAKCRKYRLFRIFSRKDVSKEKLPMLEQQILNAAGFISEEAAKKLAQNTDALLRTLEDFCQKAREVADYTVKAERESGVHGDVFSKIAKETWSLADGAQAYAGQARSTIKGIFERTERVVFERLIEQIFPIIKKLDDVAFQMNIITFNVNLNLARTVETYRERLQSIGQRYLALTSELVAHKEDIVGLSGAFLELAFKDMRDEAESRVARVRQALLELAGAAGSVAAFLRDEADKVGRCGSFVVIADEMNTIAKELSSAAERDLQSDGPSVLKMLDSHGLRVNLLAFTATLEVCRTPDQKGLTAAVEQLPVFAQRLGNAMNTIGDNLDEMARIQELLQTPATLSGSRTLSKVLEDMLLQACILFFYLKMEYEKFRWATPLQADAFARLTERGGQAATRLQQLLTQDGGEQAVRCYAGEIGDVLAGLSADLLREAKIAGVHGNAFAYIAREYGYFAERMKSVA